MKPEELKKHITSIYNSSQQIATAEDIRRQSAEAFSNSRFPTLKDEAWRHTDISPIFNHKYTSPADAEVSADDIRKFLLPETDADLLVFVNGYYKPQLSDIKTEERQVVISDLKHARKEYAGYIDTYFEKSHLYNRNIFTAANTNYASQGAFILIKKGKMPERMLHILNINHPGNTNTLVFPRNLIVAESGSAARIVESYHSLSQGVSFNTVSAELYIGENALVDYHLQQSDNDNSYQINNMAVEQDKNSILNYHALTFCGKLIRNQIVVNQNGEQCESNLNGLYLGNQEKHFDNHVLVNHMKGGGSSRQIYRGILDDASSAVYFGKVYVKQDAQLTLSEQSNKNVLLTNKAQANSKPQLEIYADDVSCAHGSTTGKLDDTSLFYLKSRGLDHELAQSLLLYAFARDVVNSIKSEAYRNHIDRLLTGHLSKEYMDNHCTRLFDQYAKA